MKSIVIAAAALVLTAAAHAQDAPAASPAPAAAPAASSAPVVEQPGTVIFFRPSRMLGGALGCTVHDGDVQVARLGNGKYWSAPVTPGKHVFRAESEAKDLLTMEIESGETYYVTCSITMGIMAGRPNLAPSDKAAFDALSGKLKPWVPKGTKVG